MKFQMLLCGECFYLTAHKVSVVQSVEGWIVCAPLIVNIFVTIEYNCKALFETPCITNGRHIEP
jgi:hypothetical protein